MRRVVITSLPRSGTAYIARLFRHLNYKSTHEGAFLPHFCHHHLKNVDIEASYAAAGYLNGMPSEYLIVHQVRNPLLVVESVLNKGMMNRGPDNLFVRFARGIVPECFEVYEGNEVERACMFYMGWNKCIQKYLDTLPDHLKVFHKVEEPKVREILDKANSVDDGHPNNRTDAQVASAISAISKNINLTRWKRRYSITPDDLTDEVRQYADRLGYKL